MTNEYKTTIQVRKQDPYKKIKGIEYYKIEEKLDEIINLTEAKVIFDEFKTVEKILRKGLTDEQWKSLHKLYVKRRLGKGDPEWKAMNIASAFEKLNVLRVPFKRAKEVLTAIFK